MSKWKKIVDAPRDGRLVRVKRVHNRSVVADGHAYFGAVTIDYGDDANASGLPAHQTYTDVWVAEDRVHLVPTPTHFYADDPVQPPA